MTKFEESVFRKRVIQNKSIQVVAKELNCNEVRIEQALRRIDRRLSSNKK